MFESDNGGSETNVTTARSRCRRPERDLVFAHPVSPGHRAWIDAVRVRKIRRRMQDLEHVLAKVHFSLSRFDPARNCG